MRRSRQWTKSSTSWRQSNEPGRTHRIIARFGIPLILQAMRYITGQGVTDWIPDDAKDKMLLDYLKQRGLKVIPEGSAEALANLPKSNGLRALPAPPALQTTRRVRKTSRKTIRSSRRSFIVVYTGCRLPSVAGATAEWSETSSASRQEWEMSRKRGPTDQA